MKPRRVSLGKTARPSLTGILSRTRLFALLDRGREGPAVWVSGPPGCGKTTLVASWLDHASVPYLWYQLDEGDADVATFFYYLSLAAADLEGGEGERLPLLTPEYQAGLAVFTRRYFQRLFAQLSSAAAVYPKTGHSAKKRHKPERRHWHVLSSGVSDCGLTHQGCSSTAFTMPKKLL